MYYAAVVQIADHFKSFSFYQIHLKKIKANHCKTSDVCLALLSSNELFTIFTLDAITEAELLTLTLDPLPTPVLDCSFSITTDAPLTLNHSHDTQPCNLASTPDRALGSAKGVDQQPPVSFWPCFTPIENSFSPSAVEDTSVELSKGLCPYEPLFDLALPRLASLFVEKKTTEAQQKAGGEHEHREELEGEDLSATSPLEVLDRLILQGYELHEKVLKR